MRLFLLAVSTCLLTGCGSSGSDDAPEATNVTKVAAPLPRGPMLGAIDLSKAVRVQGEGEGWVLDVAPGEIQFRRRDEAAPTDFYPIGPVVAGERATWTTQNPAGEPVSIVLTRAPCPGDAALPLSAQVQIGTKRLTGCAAPRLPDAKRLDADALEAPASNATG